MRRPDNKQKTETVATEFFKGVIRGAEIIYNFFGHNDEHKHQTENTKAAKINSILEQLNSILKQLPDSNSPVSDVVETVTKRLIELRNELASVEDINLEMALRALAVEDALYAAVKAISSLPEKIEEQSLEAEPKATPQAAMRALMAEIKPIRVGYDTIIKEAERKVNREGDHQLIKIFIANARRLDYLWEEAGYTPPERAFTPKSSDREARESLVVAAAAPRMPIPPIVAEPRTLGAPQAGVRPSNTPEDPSALPLNNSREAQDKII